MYGGTKLLRLLCVCVSVPHLHDAVLSSRHQQLAVLAYAAAVCCVLEAAEGAPHLTAETIIQDHLRICKGDR